MVVDAHGPARPLSLAGAAAENRKNALHG